MMEPFPKKENAAVRSPLSLSMIFAVVIMTVFSALGKRMLEFVAVQRRDTGVTSSNSLRIFRLFLYLPN